MGASAPLRRRFGWSCDSRYEAFLRLRATLCQMLLVAWLVSCLAHLGANALVDELGDGALAFVGGVQIDQRGPRGRVASAVHQRVQ